MTKEAHPRSSYSVPINPTTLRVQHPLKDKSFHGISQVTTQACHIRVQRPHVHTKQWNQLSKATGGGSALAAREEPTHKPLRNLHTSFSVSRNVAHASLPIRTTQHALLNSPRPGQYFPITTPTPAPGICSQAMKVVHLRHPTYCNDPIRHATASTHNVTPAHIFNPPPHPTHTQHMLTPRHARSQRHWQHASLTPPPPPTRHTTPRQVSTVTKVRKLLFGYGVPNHAVGLKIYPGSLRKY